MGQLRDDQSSFQSRHCTCQCTLCLSNFLGICNKLKPNPLSESSIVLRIQADQQQSGDHPNCHCADIQRLWKLQSDQVTDPPSPSWNPIPILDPFWGLWENQWGGVIVTGYSGMSSVYIYTGLGTLLLLETGSLGAPDHRGCCDCIMCCKIVSVKVRLSIVWHFLCFFWDWLHVWHVWLSECSDPWHVSSGACSTADTAYTVTMWSELVTDSDKPMMRVILWPAFRSSPQMSFHSMF